MKKFKKFIIIVVILEILIIAITNFLYLQNSKKDEPEIFREELDGIVTYKVTYNSKSDNFNIILINTSLIVAGVLTIFTYVYIDIKIVKPFSDIKEMPYELAKGNLSIPIKEEKNKYFGKFTWGMDMLRENLEDNKKKEIKYQKEKKTLILSLSHDIKTPLSAIRLYSKALKDNLYNSEEKKKEVIDGIIKNTAEIEHYVNEIVKNSREDFMDLPVNNSSYYLNEIMEDIKSYYIDKLETIHTDFVVEEYNNCLLKCDRDRIIEVIQNVMENAIKYGDGKSIKINFKEEEECKLISVTNTGCELKEEDLPHIFDSFYRGSNSKEKDGSGLGLYICKQLMLKMYGDIFVEKTNEKNFKVTIVVRKA